MAVRRGPLFWGLFLVVLGGIPLLVRAGALGETVFDDAWRLWPLLLVGVGLAIILGRRARAMVTIVLALALGTVGGGALASGDIPAAYVGDCVATRAPMERVTQGGALETPATVRLDMDCGEMEVTTTTTASWSLEADHLGAPPSVSATASSLDVTVPDQSGPHRQVWSLGLPMSSTRAVVITANAASATLTLRGMDLDRFQAEINAGDLRLNGTEARIARLDLSMNAGRARITLAGSTRGSLSANAGAMDLCVASDAALVLRVPDRLTFAHNLERRGLAHEGEAWRRSGSSGETIELTIDGNAASFTLDPEGGC